ncbi:hypothetical protein OKW41_004194 [Paraburkholderia sp. UCT70]|uniref:hypothetical protein n=1 Tax=Paraburkholderia sp. UCT70 TaxID=2991068 RepID=UPI003D24A76A
MTGLRAHGASGLTAFTAHIFRLFFSDFICDPALSSIRLLSRLFPCSFRVHSGFFPGSFPLLSLFFPAAFRFARNMTGMHDRKALLHAGFDAPAPLAPMIRRKLAGVFEHNDLSTASVSYSKSPQNFLSTFIGNPLLGTINTGQIPIDNP